MVTIKDMLEAGVHFGHQTNRWNPKMKPYIFGEKNGIYIIDLQQSAQLFQRSYDFVRNTVAAGEKVLFVGSYASHIIGWPIDKGRSLLKKLLEWSTQPQFVYRHSWCLNDLVMWDNRYCLHRGRPWDSGSHKRIMHRTTLTGDGPSVAQQW